MTIEKATLSLDRKETRTIFSKTPPKCLPLSPKTSISVHSFQLITKTYTSPLGLVKWSAGIKSSADGNTWLQANTQNLL